MVDQRRVGRNITGCAFRSHAFRFIVLVAVVFLVVVPQICRDIQLNRTFVVYLVAAFRETRNSTRQIERYVLSGTNGVTVNELHRVVAHYGTR